MRWRSPLQLLTLAVIVASCSTVPVTVEESVLFRDYYTIEESLEPDPELERWLISHRQAYQRRAGRIVATTQSPLTYRQPESLLGNLVSDLMRYRASLESERYVHIALLEPDLLGAELCGEEIRLGDIYHLIPWNETLTVVEADGKAVRELADAIAARGGIPLSGMRMVITDEGAGGILIDSDSLEEENRYHVAVTSSMLEDERYSALKRHYVRVDHSVDMRQLLRDYFRANRHVEPVEDLRVRYHHTVSPPDPERMTFRCGERG